MSLAPCPVLSFLPRPCLVHLAYVSQKAAHLSDPVWPWVWIEPPRQYNRSFTLVWTQQLDTQNLWKLLGKYLPTGSQPCLEISFGLLVSGPQREVTVGTWQETQRQALTSTCLFQLGKVFTKINPCKKATPMRRTMAKQRVTDRRLGPQHQPKPRKEEALLSVPE